MKFISTLILILVFSFSYSQDEISIGQKRIWRDIPWYFDDTIHNDTAVVLNIINLPIAEFEKDTLIIFNTIDTITIKNLGGDVSLKRYVLKKEHFLELYTEIIK